jgi:general secretion pathway protein N
VKRALLGIAALMAAALTVIALAPAAWLGDWLEAHTRVRLLDARGTVWNGSALVGVSDGRHTMLVPGRLAWNLRLASLSVELAHPAFAAPVLLVPRPSSVALKAGQAELPAATLTALGAPFNTLRPGGTLAITWTDAEWRQTSLAGDLQIEWRDAQSALSTVVPLGSYRVRLTGHTGRLTLETLRGPLLLQGSGTVKGARVSFKGLASAEPDMRQALAGLLGVLGPRSGHNAILALET